VLIGGRLWWPQSAAAQAPAVPDVVRARRFEVVDAAGKPRAVLRVYSDGSPGLAFSDAAGKARAVLGVFSDGSPGLSFSDAAGKARAVLGVLHDGGPSLAFRDAAGKVRAAMHMTEDGNPSLRLEDKNGKPRAVLGATSLETTPTAEVTMRPESSLVLFGTDGKLMWKAP